MARRSDTRHWPACEGLEARALTVAAAVIGSAVVGGVISSDAQRRAGNTASDAQQRAAEAGTAENSRQFNAIRELLAPYVNAGTGALTAQQDLIGLNGGGAQGAAIKALEGSPQFSALTRAGEEAILANASATGGLRGGNVQGALAQFRPQVLAQLIEQQYGRLGGLTSLGQNAAAGVGNAGLSTGNSNAALLQQLGAAQAGGALSQGRATSGLVNGIVGGIGSYFGRVPPTSAYAGIGSGTGAEFVNGNFAGAF